MEDVKPTPHKGWPVASQYHKMGVGYPNDLENCDCGARQIMQNLLVCEFCIRPYDVHWPMISSRNVPSTGIFVYRLVDGHE